MKKAIPAIAVSAAGLTWLLHAQGLIDATASPTKTASSDLATGGASNGSPTTRSASPTTFPRPAPGGDEEDGGPVRANPTSSTTPPTTASAPTGSSRTIDGPVINNKWGPVQVEVVLDGSHIVDVKAPQYPTHARRSQQINDQALPILHQQVIQAQSAQIDGVGGATYTTDGYMQSLQAALDKAR